MPIKIVTKFIKDICIALIVATREQTSEMDDYPEHKRPFPYCKKKECCTLWIHGRNIITQPKFSPQISIELSFIIFALLLNS